MSLKGIFPIDKWDYKSKTILEDMGKDELEQLMKHSRKSKYKKGEIIFREGGTPTGIFYIRSGKIKKCKVDNKGREYIFYVANAGELIGYHAVLAGEPYPDTAIALEESVISFIPLAGFLSTLETSTTLSKNLLKTLSHEFSVFINNLSVSAQRPVKERVAIALIILREKFKHGTDDNTPIVISISRNDIAAMAGTTRENVARVLSGFREDKIIETIGRKIIVRNVQKLVDISNQQST